MQDKNHCRLRENFIRLNIKEKTSIIVPFFRFLKSITMEKNDKFIHFVWCIVRIGRTRPSSDSETNQKRIEVNLIRFSEIGVAFSRKTFHVIVSIVVSSPPININRMECKFFRRWLTAGGGCIDGHERRFFRLVWPNDNERDISIHGFAHVSRENKLINYLFLFLLLFQSMLGSHSHFALAFAHVIQSAKCNTFPIVILMFCRKTLQWILWIAVCYFSGNLTCSLLTRVQMEIVPFAMIPIDFSSNAHQGLRTNE